MTNQEPDDTQFNFSEECRLRLSSGETLSDAAVIPRFAQDVLDVDVDDVWSEITSLPTWPQSRSIPLREDGSDPHWIPGDHPALHYRGNALKREKIWLQYRSDFEHRVIRRYNYTGWQWPILYATHAVEAMPESLQNLISKLNAWYARKGVRERLNHFILTKYASGKDNIGFHSDKDRDFAPETHFVVIKLGAPRPFAFRMKGESEPFYCKTLPAGTAVFVRCCAHEHSDANSRVQHAVPAMSEEVGASGSLVARVIRTTVAFAEAAEGIRKAAEGRQHRHARRTRPIGS